MKEKRKIVFIMTDSQRQDMVGCYGNKDMVTPNLDKLASEGLRFDKAYCCQPVCGAARAAIFTGMYPHSAGGWANSLALYANVKTVGERLHDHGVETAYIGKWHLDGSDYFGTGVCPNGWNEKYWYDMRNYLYEMDLDDRVKSRLGKTMHENGGITREFTYAHKCTNRAIDFLENNADDSFFLTVSYDEPHDPFLCPEPYASMYKDYVVPTPPNYYDTLENKPQYQKFWAELYKDKLGLDQFSEFFGCNTFVDSEIGRLLEAVEKYADDALIVYTSDHGEMMCAHSLRTKASAVYEEITKIPFIVKGKGIPKGESSDLPISQIGLTATFLEYMGFDSVDPIQGKSLLPHFENPHDTSLTEPVFMEFGRFEVIHDAIGGFQLMRGIYDGRYKLALHFHDTDEMYDLEKDPYEMKNIVYDESYAEIRNSLHDQIIEMMNETRDPFRGYQWCLRKFRPDYKFEFGPWVGTNMSRQVNIEIYENPQLEYWSGLEFMEKNQLNFQQDPERLKRMTEAQKIRNNEKIE